MQVKICSEEIGCSSLEKEQTLSDMITGMEALIQEEKKLLQRLDKALSELEQNRFADCKSAERQNHIFITHTDEGMPE